MSCSDTEGDQQVRAEDAAQRRVRFFGLGDLAIGWYVPRVVELAEQFDPKDVSTSVDDILELHNVQQYLEHGILPETYTQEERDQVTARVPQIRGAVARFFSVIDETNFETTVAGASREYHVDLLDLLGRYKAFERCDSGIVLPALTAAGVNLREMLENKKLVLAYDPEIRDLLRASPQGAEYLIQEYLQDDALGEVHLPPSFAPADCRELLERYIDSGDANPNYVGLIATSRDNSKIGIDVKLRLRAKRRRDEIVAALFSEGEGFRFGYEVSISETQDEPFLTEVDTSQGRLARHTYSSRWLEETQDSPSILNNFIHLFKFIDRQALLVLPSYPAQLGVMERFIGTPGKTEYKTGAAFNDIDKTTLLQTRLYCGYLESKGIGLERVISWFFETYVLDEFEASNFSFTPSDGGTSYLQRVRHLFAEMESVASQFALFVKDGELDRDLLAMGSEQVRYREIPSLLDGKYVYSSGEEEIRRVLYLLFSDQSGLCYINDEIRADSGSGLFIEKNVTYADFHEYQRPSVDYLISLGIVENTGARVQLANMQQFRVLAALFYVEAASYYRLSGAERAEVDVMVAKGWVSRRSSLPTDAEAKYFNYFLNVVDFSNGFNLRNSYLHGSQVNADGEAAHFRVYITALRLIVALVIKMNDDFCLSANEI